MIDIKNGLTKQRLYMFVILLAVFAMAARTPLDSDLWWHLRAGEVTWETKQPLLEDIFSYTRFGEKWVNHSWLAQVILYLLYRLGKLRAISAFTAIMAATSIYLVYRQIEGSFPVRAVIILLVALTSSVVWSPRPQTISLVLFALVGYVLYLYKWQRTNRLVWLIPLFVLWSNLHGGYVLGILLMAAMIAGEVFNHLSGVNRDQILPWGAIRDLAGVMVLAWVVVVVNPNGTAMWGIPFQTVGVQTLQDLISEWASPDFHHWYQQPLIWLALMTFASVGLSKRRLDGSELAAFSLFFYAALVARRNYGPFALVAGPILARHLSDFTEEWQARAQEKWAWYRRIKSFGQRSEENINPALQQSLNGLILLIVLIGAVGKWWVVTRPSFIRQAEREVFPVEAVAWIKENQPQGRMFNEYNWGGYLIWHLRDYPVFVDGRTDLYGDEILREYINIKESLYFEERTKDWEPEIFMIENGTSVLPETAEWRVYLFHTAKVLVKDGAVKPDQ